MNYAQPLAKLTLGQLVGIYRVAKAREHLYKTPVDWQPWYDFYQAVIVPRVEAGANLDIQLNLTAGGEIGANLVDLSVWESVLQLSSRAGVDLDPFQVRCLPAEKPKSGLDSPLAGGCRV